MTINRIAAMARGVLLGVTLAGISVIASATSQAATGDLWLRGAGATFPAPLYKRWIEIYEGQQPGVSLSYDAVGSGEGISRFLTGSVDFGATDAILSDADVAKVADGVVVVPATAGMVVLAYNIPELRGARLKLPRDVYAEIFAGKITRWNDPRLQDANPEATLPGRNIAVVARLDASGTTSAFSRHLYAAGAAWRESGFMYGTLINWPRNTMLVRGNDGVAARVKISDGSIGYVEYGFAKRLGLSMAALQNREGRFVIPSEQSGQSALGEASSLTKAGVQFDLPDPELADSYPIVTYSWLLMYRQYANADRAGAIKNFVGWGLREGQSVAGELGYIPLPSSVAESARQAILKINEASF